MSKPLVALTLCLLVAQSLARDFTAEEKAEHDERAANLAKMLNDPEKKYKGELGDDAIDQEEVDNIFKELAQPEMLHKLHTQCLDACKTKFNKDADTINACFKSCENTRRVAQGKPPIAGNGNNAIEEMFKKLGITNDPTKLKEKINDYVKHKKSSTSDSHDRDEL